MALVHTTNATKREKYLFYNTLSSLVKNLETRYTTIDLRNEICVTGKVLAVDGHMNVEMEDVILYDTRGNSKPLASFYVSARSIRYVHMPKNADAIQLLHNQLDGMGKKPTKSKTKFFKVSRAEKRNAETVRDAYKDLGNQKKD